MPLGHRRHSRPAIKFPRIEGMIATSFGGNQSSLVCALPTGIKPGELLVLIVALNAAGSVTDISTPSGWTELGDNLGTLTRVGVYYKVATGLEGLSVTVSWLTGNGRPRSAAFRVAGYQGTPEISAFTANSAATSSNPASLTPSWGTAVALWLVVLVGDSEAATRLVDTYPIGFEENKFIHNADSNSDTAFITFAMRNICDTSQDPTAFDLAGTVTEVQSFTMAIRAQ